MTTDSDTGSAKPATLTGVYLETRITLEDRPPVYGERGWWIDADETLEQGMTDVIEDGFEIFGKGTAGWKADPFPTRYDQARDNTRAITVRAEPANRRYTTEIELRLSIDHGYDTDALAVIRKLLEDRRLHEEVNYASDYDASITYASIDGEAIGEPEVPAEPRAKTRSLKGAGGS